MSDRIRVGVIGATGMVGQNYLRLLAVHPWFEVTYVAASPNSAGKKYRDAVAGRWLMRESIPEPVSELTVYDANDVTKADGRCEMMFSAVEMDKRTTAALEIAYAAAGFPVVSNSSAHRMTPDVPMVIPEINPEHLEIIQVQRRNRGWTKGLIAVKSNCSIQSYMTPVYALVKAGFPVKRAIISTMQALSGAGYPGVSGLDIVDNIVPYIKGEEEKTEVEPQKILGRIEGDRIVSNESIRIAAHCNRVPVAHGHTACVSLEFGDAKPPVDEIVRIWREFRSVPQELGLPSAPQNPIVVRNEPDRPQPGKDRDEGNGMSVSVGRLRECPVFDIRFVGLHHNTVRGAAGGAILTAELLKKGGYLG